MSGRQPEAIRPGAPCRETTICRHPREPPGEPSVSRVRDCRELASQNYDGKPTHADILDRCSSATRASQPPTRTPTTKSTHSTAPKLNPEQTALAQQLYDTGERTVQQIADLFNVPRTTVYGHLDSASKGTRAMSQSGRAPRLSGRIPFRCSSRAVTPRRSGSSSRTAHAHDRPAHRVQGSCCGIHPSCPLATTEPGNGLVSTGR